MKSILHLLGASLLLVITLFSASAQIPNGGFEDWDGLNPADWITSNNDTVLPPQSTVLVLKDTLNPYQGDNSMMLNQNWAHSSWAETTFANTSHPTSLTAFVRCDAFDTVSIKVEVLGNGEVLGEGIWEVADTSIQDWTKIVIPISQSDLEVFETRIHIQGGRIPGPADQASVLWVDGLSLGYSLLGQEDWLAQKDFLIFPNPTKGKLYILNTSPNLMPYDATLYSPTGIQLINTGEASLDMSHLPQGNYYLQLKTSKGIQTQKIVLE